MRFELIKSSKIVCSCFTAYQFAAGLDRQGSVRSQGCVKKHLFLDKIP